MPVSFSGRPVGVVSAGFLYAREGRMIIVPATGLSRKPSTFHSHRRSLSNEHPL